MDVYMAFPGVELEAEINMHPLQGYFHLLQNGRWFNNPRLTKTSRKMVLRLRKSLYGLKQSSYIWYGTFKNFMISIGFGASHITAGLFVLQVIANQGTVVAAIILYVDDLLIIANEGLIWENKNEMKKRFRMHDLGSVSIYRSIIIEHNREHYTINIPQHSYIRTIFMKFRMDEFRPVAMPMVIKHKKGSYTKNFAVGPYTNGWLQYCCSRWLPLGLILHIPSQFPVGTITSRAMIIWQLLSAWFSSSTAWRTGNCILEEHLEKHLEEHSEKHSEEHLVKVHSEEKEKAHLDVTSI